MQTQGKGVLASGLLAFGMDSSCKDSLCTCKKTLNDVSDLYPLDDSNSPWVVTVKSNL